MYERQWIKKSKQNEMVYRPLLPGCCLLVPLLEQAVECSGGGFVENTRLFDIWSYFCREYLKVCTARMFCSENQ